MKDMDADRVEVDVPQGHARQARRVITQALDAWGLTHITRGAVLVGHELVANALRHGMPPAILRLFRRDDVLVIEVGDHSERVPEIAEIDNSTSISGRGLRIVTKLTRAWGVRRHAGGKVVWAEIAL